MFLREFSHQKKIELICGSEINVESFQLLLTDSKISQQEIAKKLKLDFEDEGSLY